MFHAEHPFEMTRRTRLAFASAVAGASATCFASAAFAGDLDFSAPALLPGDGQYAAAAGHQVEADIARGGDQFLAVWSDYRTSPDDFPPFASEGCGADIFAARLDAAGNLIDTAPIMIIQEFGDQVEPVVAWDGSNWLVVWRASVPALPTYEMVQAARVAPDGTVLDPTPILVLANQSFYSEPVVAGGNGSWVVLSQANGPVDGLFAVRVTDAGVVANPGGLLVHSSNFLLDFDLAFGQDQYLITWGSPFDSPRAQRFAPDLTPIAPALALPFVDQVASDGTNFLIIWAMGSPPSATVRGLIVSQDGTLPNPPGFTLFTAGSQAGTCCANVAWDGTTYWASWGAGSQFRVARVTSAGDIVDPGGIPISPTSGPASEPQTASAPGGGLQLVWNNGVSGADYPKDVFGARVTVEAQLINETLVSGGAPAQVESDFAAGDDVQVVTFVSRVSSSARILAHRLDATGAALDAEPIEVATGPMPGIGEPSIGAPAVAWNGSLFMFTWSDRINIYARRMLADGTFVDATPFTVMKGFDPDVAAVDEVFLVVGIDILLDNPQWQAAHATRVNGATGAILDPQPNPIGGFLIFAQHPHVVSWGDRWLAVWQRNISHDETAASTTAAIILPDGTESTFEAPVGWRPDVAVSDDRALIVALNQTIASATNDLQGVVMMPNGTFGPAFLISAAADKQLDPAVTWNGSEFVVAWEDKRNSVIYFDERTDIYGARVTESGTVLDPAGVPLAADPAVPEIDPALASMDGMTMLATSEFQPDGGFGAFRVDIRTQGTPTVVADLNGDSVVDGLDLGMLLANWSIPVGSPGCSGATPCPSDLNGDGFVNGLDLGILLANWG